ncbi:MAG: hypothetical protein HYX27_10020 [Acidobacteria bacterium]|nr:hypothetical protein [Acidobacteriota bacterium]
MSAISHQVHDKFKVFMGKLADDKTIGGLADEVAAFASANKIAAKSIGVEYLESLQRIVITLGYSDEGDHYPIRLHCVPMGKIDLLGSDFTALESAMSAASARQKNIICHELYLTAEGDFLMVFMTLAD